MRGLDNAFISFDKFSVPHEALLSRFSSIAEDTGAYTLALPKGVNRMLDLLISRLLTGMSFYLNYSKLVEYTLTSLNS